MRNPSAITAPVGPILVAILFMFWSAPISSQMPDWVTVRDRDGNTMFMDRNGRIYCDGDPRPGFIRVSADNASFYLHQGAELIRNHYKREGLTVLKSILALPEKDERVRKAREGASALVNAFVKSEGDRFDSLNAQASLFHIKADGIESVINDKYGYRFDIRGRVAILKSSERKTGQSGYHGLSFSVILETGSPAAAEESASDALVALDVEKFPERAVSVARAEDHWRKTLGADTFIRTRHRFDEQAIEYEFSDAKAPYGGFEAIYLAGRKVICLRIISPAQKFQAQTAKFREILKGFSTVNGAD
ncbi:MAG: hypothetical protein EPN93_03640 [Spirochaetes bacterium]|nr:MAG: hypothetical protein EPN93_03640 [Spirochaetota bacterium]